MTDRPEFDDAAVLAARGAKNTVDPMQPWHVLIEPELTADGTLEDVGTIFLTNRECPIRCVMCDLWKNTTAEIVPAGAIPAQISFALPQLKTAKHLKLYNSGNFFDPQAIPPADLSRIADMVNGFRTVIVENHPRMCGDACVRFAGEYDGQLEVAMGLETSHEPTLRWLNKRMTLQDFSRACEFLMAHDIRVRTFVLLRPPDTSEADGIRRALDSLRFAFDLGVSCCTVIPTRSGNGLMDQLQKFGRFSMPEVASLETVLEEAISWRRGRVFGDVWDMDLFPACSHCRATRLDRIHHMNLTQTLPPPVRCDRCSTLSEFPDG
ncbi:MAG: radical SAM protein [Planctomycetaceae bacterium]